MKLITKLDTSPQTEPELLSKTNATDAFNLFLDNKTVGQVKHSLFLPRNKLTGLFSRLKRIQTIMEELVKGTCLKTAEVKETDGESGEVTIVTPAVYYEVPTGIVSLKSGVVTVLTDRYGDNISDILYDTENAAELIVAVKYVVGKLMAYTNSTNDAVFSWWKSKITG